jgi:hypothetical protein
MDPLTNKHAVTPQADGYDKGEPKNWFIAVLGLGTVVILVAVILGVQFYFDRVNEQQVYQKQMAPISDDLRNLRARDEAELHSYQYIDRNAGVVRLPIERGIELLAREAAEGKLNYPSKPTPVVVALPGAPAPAAQQGAANAPMAATPAH